MMKIKLLISLYFTVLATALWAQDSAVVQSDSNILWVDLFNPEDSVGLTVFTLINEYERFGHFGSIEEKRKSGKFVNGFNALFDSTATLPDDLSDSVIRMKHVSVEAYRQLIQKAPYQSNVIFIQKVDSIKTFKIDESGYYYTTIKVFKLFATRAIIGNKYKHGAMYTMGIRFRADTNQAYITDIRMFDGDEHSNFILGKYGRHIYSDVLVTNNLNSLVVDIPPPYVPKSTVTKSNVFVYVGYQLTSFLDPEPYRDNLGPFGRRDGTETGRSIGIKYQKAFGPRDFFGIYLGGEFEQSTYGISQSNANFIYTSDENGNPLRDLENGKYDRKHVDVTSYKEEGTFQYIKPEVGLFFNLPVKKVNFQFYGGIGNAFQINSSFKSSSIVTYQGEIVGSGAPISGDHLGFYTNRFVEVEGDYTEVQNFMFWKAGLAFDIMLGDRFAFTLMGEYKSALTYIIRENQSPKAFLDLDTGAGFTSQFNMLSESRNYNGFAILAGIKIFLNEKR